jgi:hypothetical protein
VKRAARRALLLGWLCWAVGAWSAPAADGAGIAWFGGTVEEAFALAKRERKPVFLYWGAAWCPPCNALKATVFRRPDFVAKTRLFVPVYIDGDGSGAQRWQDHFGTLGYPTLIVFDADGRELTRIPGGMDLERYAEVLDLALERIAPVREILDRYLGGGQPPAAAEWRLLAAYSWQQDAGRALGGRDALAVARTLADGAPAGMVAERARLQAEYLRALVRDGEVKDAAARADAVTRILGLLESPPAAAAVASFLGDELGEVIRAVTAAGSDARGQLLAAWRRWSAAQWAAAGAADRLGLLRAELAATTLGGGTVDAAMRGRVNAAVDAALARAGDPQLRSATLHDAAGVLAEAGEPERAMGLLRAAVADGSFDYYWMADLAGLAEDLGRRDEALAWLARAWRAAKGPATRVQWGSRYVDGLVRLDPGDSATIGATLTAMFDEMDAEPEVLRGRNRSALARTGTALAGWATTPGRERVYGAARARLGALCERDFGQDPPALAQCRELMGGAARLAH